MVGAPGLTRDTKVFLAVVVALVVVVFVVLSIVFVVTKSYKSPEWKHCVAEGPMVMGQSESELESACDKVVEMTRS